MSLPLPDPHRADAPRRVLLLGATGFFGQRLSRLLVKLPEIELVAASRERARADALVRELKAGIRTLVASAVALDTTRDVAGEIKAIAPWLVIDCTGPFQGGNYRVAEAAIAAGAHFMDIADARDHITGFATALHDKAVAAGVTTITGASTTPAITGNVVRDLTDGWQRVDDIDIVLMPAGASDVGAAVIDAVLSYAGQPVTEWREGKLNKTIGWGSLRRVTIPGLPPRWVSPVETADADLFGERHRIASTLRFGAGLDSALEQIGIVTLANLKRMGMPGRLTALTSVLKRGRKVTGLMASDTGGMIVTATGLNADGESIMSHWRLIASDGHGPYVPVLAVMAAVRKLLANTLTLGAMTADMALALPEIMEAAEGLAIKTAQDSNPLGKGLFLDALPEDDISKLPQPVAIFHQNIAKSVWSGTADIDNGRNPLARLIRLLFGFPRAGRGVPLTVSVARSPDREVWTRNFAGKCFRSELSFSGTHVTERFGPFTFTIGLKVDAGRLSYPVTGWRLGPLPLPLFLAPRSESFEDQTEDGRFRFDVKLSMPLAGLVAHYRGTLDP
jgi:Domain of unknown function (DUF4166)/Saccharopine dehydrogenase NADP binding domain